MSPYNYKGKLYSFIVTETFIKLMANTFKDHSKTVEMFKVNLNVTILNRPYIMWFSNIYGKNINNVICNKTAAQPFTILRQ